MRKHGAVLQAWACLALVIIFGMQHHEENDVNDCSFAHLTLILLLYYL